MLHTAPAAQLVDRAHQDRSAATPSLAEVVVITVQGELDLYTAPGLRDALHEVLPPSPAQSRRSATAQEHPAGETGARVRAVVVDLSGVDFMDSYALGIVVHGHHLARRGGRGYALVGTSPRIHELFALTGLARVMPLHPDLLTALAVLPPASAPAS